MSSCQDLMYRRPEAKFMPNNLGACFCINPQCGRVGRCLKSEIIGRDTKKKQWPGILNEKVDEAFKSLVGEIDKETEEATDRIYYAIAWRSGDEWFGGERIYETYEEAEQTAKEDLTSDDLCEEYQILSTIAYVERPPVTEAVVRRVVN